MFIPQFQPTLRSF